MNTFSVYIFWFCFGDFVRVDIVAGNNWSHNNFTSIWRLVSYFVSPHINKFYRQGGREEEHTVYTPLC